MANLNNMFARMSELGITAKKLSDLTGISTGNISDWKNGRSFPTAIKLEQIAEALNCSVDYLLGRTDNPSFNPSDELDKTALKFALFGNTPDISDDDMANVLRYAQFIKENKKNEK